MATFIRVGDRLVNSDLITTCRFDENGKLLLCFVGEDPRDYRVFFDDVAHALWQALADGVPDRLAPYVVWPARTEAVP